jgi:hypothetical protein
MEIATSRQEIGPLRIRENRAFDKIITPQETDGKGETDREIWNLRIM